MLLYFRRESLFNNSDKEKIIDIESVNSTDLFVEEQIEMDNMAGTWGSASTFSGCAATASSGGSASSFG